jgi:hypothetical protein
MVTEPRDALQHTSSIDACVTGERVTHGESPLGGLREIHFNVKLKDGQNCLFGSQIPCNSL